EMPLAERTGLRLTLPLQRYQMPGSDNDFDFGDIALRLHHIPVVTKTYGVVVQGELIFDTAGRHELGYGTTVLKGTAIYARFLSNGSILAPSLSHSEALGGHTDVSETVLDLYYVPRLADSSIFVTVDPAIISNWETDAVYGSLAVTVGKTVGKMWNGTAQVYVKPTLLVGNDRPADWAVEVGFKVLGF
ncbi:hypothetical protein, partial [Paracoccus sp. (in: a-proteobacteria)]|uniref:hypothetical protein n=1 Tax=Paracoccus sp. TaxID=267 RepID=UPI0028A8D507